jgi:hypothetical protein
MAEKFEYVIRQIGEIKYEVAKFRDMSGGEQPLARYEVLYGPPRQMGRCDCPAGVYRQMGPLDKHVKLVAQWISEGKPVRSYLL